MKRINAWLFKDSEGYYRIATRRKGSLVVKVLPDKWEGRDQAEYVRKFHI